MVSTLASCARGPGFDLRKWRGKVFGPNTLPFMSFANILNISSGPVQVRIEVVYLH